MGNGPAHLLLHALRHHLVEVLQASFAEIGLARLAVLAVHRRHPARFEADNHLEPVVVQVRDRLPRHQQVLFRRRLQRVRNVQQPRFHHHHSHRNALCVLYHNLRVGPLPEIAAAAPRPAEQSQLHRSRIHRTQGACQVANKLVCPGKPNLRVADAKLAHALEQADGVGHGDVEVRLLQAVAQAGVKQFDPSCSVLLHLSLFAPVKVSFKQHRSAPQRRTSIIPARNCIARNRCPIHAAFFAAWAGCLFCSSFWP